MTIYVKNKDTLIIDDFTIKCCVGKNGISSRKKEGDLCTPKGLFNLNKLYFRKDKNELKNSLTITSSSNNELREKNLLILI